MPFYLKFDGVDGTVSSRHTGGMNVCMADGSVRFLKYSTGGGLAKVGAGSIALANTNTYSGISGHKFTLERHFDYGGGVNVAAGDLTSDAPVAVEVSRIVLPNPLVGFNPVDSHDVDAVGKTRMMFNAAGGFGLRSGLVVSVARAALSEAARRAKNTNNLKQLGLGMHGRIPVVQLLACDAGNSNVLAVEMKNVLVTSYQISGHGGDTHSFPTEHFSMIFAAVRCYP